MHTALVAIALMWIATASTAARASAPPGPCAALLDGLTAIEAMAPGEARTAAMEALRPLETPACVTQIRAGEVVAFAAAWRRSPPSWLAQHIKGGNPDYLAAIEPLVCSPPTAALEDTCKQARDIVDANYAACQEHVAKQAATVRKAKELRRASGFIAVALLGPIIAWLLRGRAALKPFTLLFGLGTIFWVFVFVVLTGHGDGPEQLGSLVVALLGAGLGLAVVLVGAFNKGLSFAVCILSAIVLIGAGYAAPHRYFDADMHDGMPWDYCGLPR